MYTLKLDLTEYERNVLTLMLQNERERGERGFTEESPWHQAILRIQHEIDGYRAATEQAKAIVASEDIQ